VITNAVEKYSHLFVLSRLDDMLRARDLVPKLHLPPRRTPLFIETSENELSCCLLTAEGTVFRPWSSLYIFIINENSTL
jgi:hypothetical protein